MLDFAQCMREHGIDMPDPQFNGDGRAACSPPASGGGRRAPPLDKAKMDEAQKACQSFLDKVQSNMPPPDPAEMEKQKQKMLDFAQCMRDHGIDFPDPQINTDGGGLQVQMGGPGMDPSSPAFKEANDACATEVGMPAARTVTGGGPASAAAAAPATGAGTRASREAADVPRRRPRRRAASSARAA